MGLMSETTPDSLTPAKAEERPAKAGDAAPVAEIPTTDALRRIAVSVNEDFRTNADHRQQSGVDETLVNSARAARLKYSPHQEEILRGNRLDPRSYPPLTRKYMRVLEAMLLNIVSQSGDKPYTLSPSPSPTVPKSVTKKVMERIAREIAETFLANGGAFESPAVEQLFYVTVFRRASQMFDEARHAEAEWARERCDRMDRKIHDQMVEGKFMREFAKLVRYFSTYGTAGMTFSPRVVPMPKCRESGSLDALQYTMQYERIPVFEAVSPWDCYPAPNAKSVDDGPLCIRVRYTADTLWQYADASDEAETEDGWQRSTVRALLSKYPRGGVHLMSETSDFERRRLERDSIASISRDCTLEGIRRFASVRGSDLIAAGIDKTPTGEKIVQNRFYETDVTVIADYVVCCRIVDDRMPRPFVKAALYEFPDSWWGESLADILCSSQTMQNNALKNLTVNGAIASNPIFVCSNVDRVVSLDGQPGLAIRGGRMLGFKKDAAGNVGSPVAMLQATDLSRQMIQQMHEAQSFANDDSGVPLHALGSSQNLSSGAARTVGGMNMLQESALRTVNMSVIALGMDVVVPCVEMLNAYNLVNDKDMSIKGDVVVAPSGMMGKILREAESQKRLQLFNALGGPQIVGPALTVQNFFELLRPEIAALGSVNPDKVIPSKERMEAFQQVLDVMNAAKALEQQAQPAAPAPDGGGANPGNPSAAPAETGGQPPEQPEPPAPGTVAERRGAA